MISNKDLRQHPLDLLVRRTEANERRTPTRLLSSAGAGAATPPAGSSHRTFPFKANGNTGFIQVDEGDLLPESRCLVLQEIQPHEVQSRLASKA